MRPARHLADQCGHALDPRGADELARRVGSVQVQVDVRRSAEPRAARERRQRHIGGHRGEGILGEGYLGQGVGREET